MGQFDRTICDCCVCPMQCVIKQLVGQTDVLISTPVSQEANVTINSVENFIADTDAGIYSICNVTAVSSATLGTSTTLKPVRQDKKGACSCCENPATNELNKLVNQNVAIEFITQVPGNVFQIPLEGTILKVGEGIVILNPACGQNVGNPIAISTCQITRIEISST
ncbi:hypothetical protein VQL36_08965 [Chengkuizengella sp. SCS-71B]|uniref:hypothetical protein n=1 Tax=Chengkuizengella sp. SCS-71B TaxID=3115290 RepID=UPI0032C23DDB